MSIQGSDAWKRSRSGKVTASMISNVLMKPDTAGYQNYQTQLVAEILNGEPDGSDYTNANMQYGTEMEPFARSAYEAKTGLQVDEVGMCQHPTIERAGASPDGLVGTSGLVEIKCPKRNTHIQYLLAGVVPAAYKNQMMFQMACTDRQWVDFVSFRLNMPEHLQLIIVRYKRDPARILELETAVIAFLKSVDTMINQLNEVK